MDASYPLSASAAARARPRYAALRRAWPLALAVAVIGVIGAGFVFSPYGRTATISALVLPDMMVDLPVRPVTWFTPEPVVEHTVIDYGSGRMVADIYRPGDDERHAAVVFSMGAPPLDLDDERLVKLGKDAARAGLVMVVPFSERLDDEMIDPEEVDALVGVFDYAAEQPYVDAERVGYIGVSVGGSLALLAAADPAIADRADYVVSFGGYYDGLDILVAIASGDIAYDGVDERWEPDPHSVRVIAEQIIVELPDAGDRAALTKAFVRHRALSDGEIASLTPEGLDVYEFMTSSDADEALARRDDLPSAVLEKMMRLSPSQTIDDVKAELFIIHDQGDEFIPYVESRRLRDALDGRGDVHFTEVSLFEHVEPRLSRGGDVIVLDGARLYFRLYQLLRKLS
jgi:hypothetical protein